MSHVKIFFDESGKNNNKPHLMGALLIPDTILSLTELSHLEPLINKGIHWTDYKGHSVTRKRIEYVVEILDKHFDYFKFNLINYDQSIIEKKSIYYKDVDGSLGNSTIYMKLPERIIYGLLRNYGKITSLTAEIVIEEAEEYKTPAIDLKNTLTRQLNIQALYRGENFKIISSRYAPKKTELGLECTDLLLGIIRTIIENPLPDSASNVLSSKKRSQISLILKLLKNKGFHSFLQRVTFYELADTNLREIHFNTYLNVFITQNYNEFLT
ncbi:hypothetical protein JOC54_000293 [Alkalihalobacillus xiaoxiensis]|uniref:DUF3800 domain-containing protein n=1 Tax=Shouchella xiaoxiensis TaxID=766895 RepID=A0ABS2SNG4_9BACI|nr:DUF3800 domain-containing protein [Shouchella xiaoxiensis]MBM7837062.1 hypothetical protein [Shouchella xiaoxiensis]